MTVSFAKTAPPVQAIDVKSDPGLNSATGLRPTMPTSVLRDAHHGNSLDDALNPNNKMEEGAREKKIYAFVKEAIQNNIPRNEKDAGLASLKRAADGGDWTAKAALGEYNLKYMAKYGASPETAPVKRKEGPGKDAKDTDPNSEKIDSLIKQKPKDFFKALGDMTKDGAPKPELSKTQREKILGKLSDMLKDNSRYDLSSTIAMKAGQMLLKLISGKFFKPGDAPSVNKSVANAIRLKPKLTSFLTSGKPSALDVMKEQGMLKDPSAQDLFKAARQLATDPKTLPLNRAAAQQIVRAISKEQPHLAKSLLNR